MTDWLAMLHSTGVICLLATATLGVGAPLAALLRIRTSDRLERLVWESSLGFLTVTTLLGWLGQLELLHRGAIVAATWIAAAAGCYRLWQLFVETNSGQASARETANEPPSWLSYGLRLAAGLAIIAAYVSALAPPTAGDALTYHLELPKRFLQAGGLTFNPDDDNIVYPLVAEIGFLWALAFDDAAATALVHWGCGLLLIGATYVLARPHVGSGWARAAACVTALTPGVNNQMTAPLNDVALALFAVLAVAAWLQAQQNGTWRDFALVGLMLGGAIGVKFTGLLFAAALGAVWLVAAVSDIGRRRQLFSGLAAAATMVCVTAGLWFGRAAWYRGDPIYPFLTRQTDPTGPDAFPQKKTPLGRGPTAILSAPWAMTMEPARFGGRGHQLGPLFLMFVPVAIALRSTTVFSSALWIAALYGGGCLLLRQNLRFLLPIVPILAAAIVAGWREMRSWPRAPRWIITATAAGIVLFLTAVPVARLRHTATATLGDETFAEFLRRTEPTYEMAQWINANLPPQSRILSDEQRAFYLTPAVTRESLYSRRTKYGLQIDEAPAHWKADGYTHLLTAAQGPARHDDDLPRLLSAVAADQAKPIAATTIVREWRHVDAEGAERHYALWELR
jgi:hypothetical protein